MQKIIHRTFQYLDYKGIPHTRFEKDIGLSNGYLKVQLKRNADVGESVINKIIDYCLDINPIWLLTGKGEMLKNDAKTAHNPLPTAEKGGENAQKMHIPPQPQDDFVTDIVTNQSRYSPKSGIFPQNTTPIFCPSCASKEQVITALNELTQQLKARLNDKDQLIAVLNEKLSAETSENPNKHGVKGKQNKTA
jgi:hypothetical protein